MVATKMCKFLCGSILMLGILGLVYLGVKAVTGAKGHDGNAKGTSIGRTATLDSSVEDGHTHQGQKQPAKKGSEAQESAPTVLSEPNAKQRMEEQLRLAASVFDFDLQEGFSRDEIVETPLSNQLSRELLTHDDKFLIFDCDTGELRSYSCSRFEEVPEGLSKKDAISEAQAMMKVKELLQKLGTDEGLEIGKVYFEDSRILAEPGSDGQLEGAAWVVDGHYKYKTIPYQGSSIHIEVSAYSGNILTYWYQPMGSIPESLEEKINATQALSIAQKFLNKWYRHEFSADQLRKPEKCISHANNCWTRRRGEMIKYENEPILCWLVRVKPENEEESAPVVKINATTGEVCGGAN